MSDEENRAGQQEEEQVKSEDPNAPINIKVCGGVFLWGGVGVRGRGWAGQVGLVEGVCGWMRVEEGDSFMLLWWWTVCGYGRGIGFTKGGFGTEG